MTLSRGFSPGIIIADGKAKRPDAGGKGGQNGGSLPPSAEATLVPTSTPGNFVRRDELEEILTHAYMKVLGTKGAAARWSQPTAQGNAAQDPAAPAVPTDADLLAASKIHEVLRELGTLASRSEGRDAGSSAEVKRLRDEIAKRDMQLLQLETKRQFDELRHDMEAKTASAPAIAPTPARDGISDKILELLVSESLKRQDPQAYLGQLAAFSNMLTERSKALAETNAVDLERDKLGLAWRRFEFEGANAAQARQLDHDRISKLTEIAQQAFKETWAPISQAVGRAVEERVARGGRPLTPEEAARLPPPPSAQPVAQGPPTVEQLAADASLRAGLHVKLDEATRVLEEHRRLLQAAEAQANMNAIASQSPVGM